MICGVPAVFTALWRRGWGSNPRENRSSNGFQDRLVMTTSIPLRVYSIPTSQILTMDKGEKSRREKTKLLSYEPLKNLIYQGI